MKEEVSPARRLPPWLTVRAPSTEALQRLKPFLEGLHTVCESAQCPNRGYCFSRGTATFMILGHVCTRRCGFCAVSTGRPLPPDPAEPQRLACAVRGMGLRHAVVTSVTRDDLADGGASLFAETVRAIHRRCPGVTVEVLIPDFRGSVEALRKVVDAHPEVVNHNVETVPRLYRKVRPQALYARSLQVLAKAKLLDPAVPTKSGMMLGLGETKGEILEVMRDLRAAGCDMLTLGQYLRPSPQHLEVVEYLPPAAFQEYGQQALGLGFAAVAAGPLVRSSFNAAEVYESLA